MPLILPGNVGSATASSSIVSNSCRFNDDDSAYMHKTPGSASNRRTFTFSCWLKRSALGIQTFFSAYNADDATRPDEMRFTADDRLYISFRNTEDAIVSTARLFRDVTAWYHICVAVDTTQGTAANRVKIYVNGTQETVLTGDGAGDSASYMSQNFQCGGFNRNSKHQIGSRAIGTPTLYYDGYMAEAVFIDGSALAPTSFGEFDSDTPTIWKPINVSGLTFGTNGFYLDFEDSSNLGNDANGGTDLTEVNLSALDQSTDTCENNFCTLNSLYYHSTTFTYSEGNTKATTGTAWKTAGGTIGMTSGKWYWEFTKSGSYVEIGIGDLRGFAQGGSNFQGLSHTQDTNAIGIYYNSSNGEIYSNNTSGAETNPGSYGASFDTEVIGCALDLDSAQNTVTFYKANSSQGAYDIQDPVDGYTPSFTIYNSNVTVNFGGTQTVALSSAESDANGYGSFEYAPPSGYYSICTKNLAEYG
jgi:hypothetical protein